MGLFHIIIFSPVSSLGFCVSQSFLFESGLSVCEVNERVFSTFAVSKVPFNWTVPRIYNNVVTLVNLTNKET